MIERQKKTFILLSAAASVISLIGAIFMYLAFAYQFDNKIQHFDSGSIYFIISTSAIIISLILALISAICIRKKISISSPLPSPSISIFSSALTGFMFVAYGIMSLIDLSKPYDSKFEIILPIFAIISGVYFILSASSIDKKSNAYAVCGIFPVIFSAASLMSVYFDRSMELNNPNKIMLQVMYISFMLFFVAECKFALDRQTPEKYLFFSVSSVITTSLVFVPRLILILTANPNFKFDLMQTVLLASLWIYFIVRTFTSISNFKEYVPAPIQSDAEKNIDAEKESAKN